MMTGICRVYAYMQTWQMPVLALSPGMSAASSAACIVICL